jgi:hypothetical protein
MTVVDSVIRVLAIIVATVAFGKWQHSSTAGIFMMAIIILLNDWSQQR